MTATMKKYADVVRAYLDGAEVQYRLYGAEWHDVVTPFFDGMSHIEYRIKPKEPRIVEKYIPVGFNTGVGCINAHHHVRGTYKCCSTLFLEDNDINYSVIANIKLRCNEETGEVLSVELIKEKT